MDDSGKMRVVGADVQGLIDASNACGAKALRPLQPVEVQFFPSAEALADVVARNLVTRVAEGQVKNLAVSGGRVAVTLFRATVIASRRLGVDWSGIHLFWADERCVPPEHPESNYRTAREHLIEPLGIPCDHVHRVLGELDPARGALEAEANLVRLLAGNPLDLVLLGMGDDGHVASLFPDQATNPTEESRHYIPVVGPKPPRHRISLSYGALAAASAVWVLVVGEGKRPVLEAAISGEPTLPLSVIRGARPSSGAAMADPAQAVGLSSASGPAEVDAAEDGRPSPIWSLPLGRLITLRRETQLFAAV
jgi:6-phosphogluconolactonase